MLASSQLQWLVKDCRRNLATHLEALLVGHTGEGLRIGAITPIVPVASERALDPSQVPTPCDHGVALLRSLLEQYSTLYQRDLRAKLFYVRQEIENRRTQVHQVHRPARSSTTFSE
jgi:hypothetical protein